MKLNKILLDLLYEQNVPDNFDVDLNDEGQNDNNNNDEDGHHLGDEDLRQLNRYDSPYTSTGYKQIKEKWHHENSYLTEMDMDNVITIFNNKKNNLIPFREDFTAPNVPNQGTPNQSEVVSLKEFFPDFPAENIQKLKDLNSYTWNQIDYFTQRFISEDESNQNEMQTSDVKNKNFEEMIEIWKNYPTKVVDNDGLLVIKIRNRQDAMILGKLNEIYKDRYSYVNRWCITYTEPSYTYYQNYRKLPYLRSYYFVLRYKDAGTEKERDNYFMSVLQPSPTNDGPYIITPGDDMDRKNLSWDQVIRIYPEITNYQDLFIYQPITKEEQNDILLNRINFIDKNSPNYFIGLPTSIQSQYIATGNNIKYLNAIASLNKTQLNSYILGTTVNNYLERYVSENPNNRFEILDFLKKSRAVYYRSLDIYLKSRLGITNGIKAIKNYFLLRDYKRLYRDIKNPNIRLLVNTSLNNNGIFDYDQNKFIIDPIYIEKGRYIMFQTVDVPRLNVKRKIKFLAIRYDISDSFLDIIDETENNNPQTFYVIYKTDNINNDEKKYDANIILDKASGDKLWNIIKSQRNDV